MLTPLEERIYAIFGTQSMLGDDEVQPSTSRAPPVEGPPSAPSAANSPATSKRKHRADAKVEARTSAAGDSPPAASKRSRKADDTVAANPTEIPRSSEEQNRLSLQQRRLDVQEGMLAEMQGIALLFERSVLAQESMANTLREINENIATIIEHLD